MYMPSVIRKVNIIKCCIQFGHTDGSLYTASATHAMISIAEYQTSISIDSHGKNTTHRCITYPDLILSSFPGIPSSPIHKPLLQMLLCISCLHSQLLAQSTGSSIASAGHINCSSRINPYVITSDCIYIFLHDAFCKYHNVALQCIRNDKLLM